MFNRLFSFTPTLKESFILFLCVVLCGTILALPTTFPQVKDIEIISTFLAYILTLSPAFVYAWLKATREQYSPKYKINDPYFGRLHPAILFALLPFILVAYLIVTEPASTALTTPEWFDQLMKSTALGENVWCSILTTCICAPILEELLCRGLMLRGMIENGKHPASAIVWSSIIFGILHMNPWQAIPAILVGLLMGYMYYKTRCIWVPIALHVLNNSLSTLLYYLFPEIPSDATFRGMIGDSQIYFAIFAISIAVLALSYFTITKFVGKRNEQETVISA